jgi:hypothetical protein
MGGGVSTQKNDEDKSYITKLKRTSEASILRLLGVDQKFKINENEKNWLPIDAGSIGVCRYIYIYIYIYTYV